MTLEQLRKQAKELIRAVRAQGTPYRGAPVAVRRRR
jgi:hypothetical protein